MFGILDGKDEKPAPTKEAFRSQAQAMVNEQKLVNQAPRARMYPEFSTERADPVTVPSTIEDRATSFVQMLVGPQLGLLGVKWDEHGWNQSLDNLKRQWTEVPLWSNLVTLGMTAALAAPVAYSARYGAIGKSLNRGFKFVPDRAGILGKEGSAVNPTYWFKQFRTAEEEASMLRYMGILAPDARGTPKELAIGRVLAHKHLGKIDTFLKQQQDVAYTSEVLFHAKQLDPKLNVPDMVYETLPKDIKAQAEQQAMANGAMPADVTLIERAKWAFDKRFENKAFERMNDVTPQGQLTQSWKEEIDTHFGPDYYKKLGDLEMLGEKDPLFAQKYMRTVLMRADGKDRFPGLRHDPVSQPAIDGVVSYHESIQASMKETHFLPEDMPPIHIQATRAKGTRYEVHSLADLGNVNAALNVGPLKERKTDLDQVAELVKKGSLQAKDVSSIRMMATADDMLHHNYMIMRDVMKKREFKWNPFRSQGGGMEVTGAFGTPSKPSRASITPVARDNLVGYEIVPYDEMIKRYGGDPSLVPKHYVSGDSFFKNNRGGHSAMINMMKHPTLGDASMITKDIHGSDRLPFVPKFIADAFVGEAGIFAQSTNAIHGLEALGMIHKAAKTGLNPGSHGQNILGGIAFTSMAGLNLFSPRNQRLLKQTTDAFQAIHDTHMKVRARLGADAPLKVIQAEIRAELAMKGKSITHKRADGSKFTISYADLARDVPAQLYEAGSFDAVEGGEALNRAVGQRGATPGAKAVNTAFQYVRGRGKAAKTGVYSEVGVPVFGSLGELFDGMSKWYMGEDIIPKLALFVHHRANGLTEMAAASEVARRTPMYSTSGAWIKEGRKVLFPWASFPTEALRIIKNNIQDNPLRTLPWLYAVQIAQASLATMGAGEGNLDAVSQAKLQLPVWAQTPGTLMTASPTGSIGPHVLPGAATGAMLGAAVGGAMGGPLGAVAGGAAGVAANVGAPLLWESAFKKKDDAGTQLRGAVLNWLPHTAFMLRTDSPQYGAFDDGITASEGLRRLYDTLPAEPLAIFRPIIDLVTGESGFGEPTPGEGVLGAAGNFARGLLGFLAPPLIQKYGFKTTTPDVGLVEATAIKLGMPLPDPLRRAGITNISKLLVDLGTNKDPMTGLPGNPILDIFLNSGLGTLKSYPGVAERYFANEEMNSKSMAEVRNFHSRNLSFHIANGDDTMAGDLLRRVFMTFQQQYPDDPGKAVDMYGKWIKTKFDDIGRSKLLAHINKDELVEQMDASLEFAREGLNFARKTRIEALQNERMVRRLHEVQRKELKDGGAGLDPKVLQLISQQG